MTYLPIVLIVAGYVALVATAGPLGLALAVVHIAIMAVAAHMGGKKK